MSSLPSQSALRSWTNSQLKRFLTERSVRVPSNFKKEQLINKVREIQLREQLVDSTVYSQPNNINDNNQTQEETIVVTKTTLEAMIQQAIQDHDNRNLTVTNEQQSNNQLQLHQQVQNEDQTQDRNRVEDFLLMQMAKARSDDDRPVPGIKRDLKNGLYKKSTSLLMFFYAYLVNCFTKS